MKKKVIVIALIVLFIIVVVSIFYFMGGKANFSGNQKDNNVISLATAKKVVWYRILMPVKNESKGWIYIKTEDGLLDSARLNASQMAAAMSILNNKNTQYSNPQNNLIIEHDFTTDTLTNNR